MHFRSQSKRRIVAACFAIALAACGSDDESDSGGNNAAKLCGNKKIDGKELCDGTVPATENCAKATMGSRPSGTLTCSTGCTFDTTKCTSSGGAGGVGGSSGSSGGGGISGSSGSSGFGGGGGMSGSSGAGGGP